ncbi:MAG: sigma-70 family RNA polymerase sigma factor [Microbacterium sp.]|nr:sigma-70 family RNA polymerase sigma factor [Microbacterium sp.]
MATTHGPTGDLAEATDQELVAVVRSGDSRAYGVLWARHSGSAYGVARSFPTLDADDLVSEAFVKVLFAIQDGRGPEGLFRPYITMTVRNLARTQFVREPAMLDVDVELESQGTPSGEEQVVEAYERSMMLGAFQTLPPRWQEVLWHSEVEGLRPREVAQYLGIPANAVSALLIRAKRGLKDAWVAAHLAKADSPECRATISELGAYVRNGLSQRSTLRVETHLSTCANCKRALEEAQNASHLTLALFPAVVGIPAVGAYAAQLSAPPLPQALVALGVEPYPDLLPTGRAGESRSSGRRGAVVIAGALVLLLGVGATLAFIAQDSVEVTAGEGAPAPTPATTTTPSTTAPSFPPPIPEPSPSVDPSAPMQTEDPRPPSEALTPPAANPAPAPPQNPSGSLPGGVAPEEGSLAPPVATLSQSDPRMYPVVAGTDAAAGAAVQLIDDNGSVIGSTVVRGDGTWRARITEGDSGAKSVRVRQSLDGQTSPLSSSLAYVTTPPPDVTAPSGGSPVTASSFVFSFAAAPGDVVQREVRGVTSVFTLRMPASGVWNERMSVPRGTHTMTVRYVDPATGDFGPRTVIEFIAQ